MQSRGLKSEYFSWQTAHKVAVVHGDARGEPGGGGGGRRYGGWEARVLFVCENGVPVNAIERRFLSWGWQFGAEGGRVIGFLHPDVVSDLLEEGGGSGRTT